MEGDFLTIKEAIKKTGTSNSTIRRLIIELRKDEYLNTLLKVPTHNNQFYYKISEKTLFEHYPEKKMDTAQPVAKEEMTSTQKEIEHRSEHRTEDGHRKTIEVLEKQLDRIDIELKVKDKQLARKDEQIDTLLERARESNVLLKNAQDKLFLLERPKPYYKPQEPKSTQKVALDTKQTLKTSHRQTQKPRVDTTPTKEKKPQRKGFWKEMWRVPLDLP